MSHVNTTIEQNWLDFFGNCLDNQYQQLKRDAFCYSERFFETTSEALAILVKDSRFSC